MSRLCIAAAQSAPVPVGTDLRWFEEQALELRAQAPEADLLVFPELHLFGGLEHEEPARETALRESAVALESRSVSGLAAIARRLGVWLVPGSVCERGPAGELFNTAVVLSPAGELAAFYRKLFPWRPFEPYVPGDRFVVVDIPGKGRLGLSICFDAWFPEVGRHLAWYGADVVLNLVKTTTADRHQELVLARANSIVNQVFTVSVNAAGPLGTGRSITSIRRVPCCTARATSGSASWSPRSNSTTSSAYGPTAPPASTGCGRSSGPMTRRSTCRFTPGG